ncbi:MAG: hypothetical protein JWP13_680 [Candidatus Saccharibacteria bacterium]|nr:hypothetical protein [Candidatus Saccharibacteria bacterium]
MNHNSAPNYNVQPPTHESLGVVVDFVPHSEAHDKPAGIEVRPDGAEFNVDGITYNYLGQTDGGYMEFTSVSDDGLKRPFLVYTSRSEGALRVSQGLEIYEKDGRQHTRLMKGPEMSPRAQYTQDTQLHPKFEDKIAEIEVIRELRQLPVRPTPKYDHEGAEWFLEDFDKQTATYPLGSEDLDRQLKELPVSRQSVSDVKQITGYDPTSQPGGASAAYLRKIDDLNKAIQASGIMPDFSQTPTTMEATRHPILGDMIRETFEKSVHGVVYQWQMARDRNGRVWIDRIRFADTQPTAYGTDEAMVYSGLLTSKPIDYKEQSEGLPANLRTDMGNGYNDVSEFLKKLAPIQEYSKHCYRRDQNYIFASAA